MPKRTKRDLKVFVTDQLGHDPARVQVMRPHEDLVKIYGYHVKGDPMRQVDIAHVFGSPQCQKFSATRVI